MKALLIALLLIASYLVGVDVASHRENITAVIQMDGKGWYRVEHYWILKNGECVRFVNGTGGIETFCGAFGVTERKDFYKLPSKP